MARVHQSSQFTDHTFHNNHDQQPQQTYSSPVTRGRGRGRGRGRRGNRASSSDPSKADAKDTTSGTPNVRAKPMNTSTEVSPNVEPVKVWLPKKNVNISPLQATIEQKEKELQLCGQKIDTLNSQLNKATTDLKCARAKNEDMAINVNSLQQELEKCRKEISSLKDKNEEWAKKNAELCSKTTELESLVLYYTNRAAKRVSLKKFRKAIDDCRMATYLDPGCLNVRLIAGNCHLVLGEIDEALCCYKKCLDSGMVCFDRRLTFEASDGLQNAELPFASWGIDEALCCYKK